MHPFLLGDLVARMDSSEWNLLAFLWSWKKQQYLGGGVSLSSWPAPRSWGKLLASIDWVHPCRPQPGCSPHKPLGFLCLEPWLLVPGTFGWALGRVYCNMQVLIAQVLREMPHLPKDLFHSGYTKPQDLVMSGKSPNSKNWNKFYFQTVSIRISQANSLLLPALLVLLM